MRFMLLIHFDEGERAPADTPEALATLAEYAAVTKAFKEEEVFVTADRLKPTSASTCVRLSPEGKLMISDGPFAETKEQLAGFYVVEAEDKAQAEVLAARLPGAEAGFVEVREMWSFP